LLVVTSGCRRGELQSGEQDPRPPPPLSPCPPSNRAGLAVLPACVSCAVSCAFCGCNPMHTTQCCQT
jgi:hypothetical protein